MVIDEVGDGSFELPLGLSLVRQPDDFTIKFNKLEPLESFDEFSNLQACQYGNKVSVAFIDSLPPRCVPQPVNLTLQSNELQVQLLWCIYPLPFYLGKCDPLYFFLHCLINPRR
jgi:hypothetical protein